MKSSGKPNDVVYKEVVIIGNGPSGIALSYMLSGNLPYLISDTHPDEMLSMRLRPHVGKCLINQDLGHLASGLEGRSTNPVSLLLDSLLHPYADVGLEMAPLVEFRRAGPEIDHIVLGKGPPGGSWHTMDPYVLTLSLGAWMSLPGLPLHSRDFGEKRAFACNVANYYVDYVKSMNLSRFFVNSAVVTGARMDQDPKEDSSEENLKDDPRTCPLSSAFDYILSRGNRKLKPGRCCKRPRDILCQDQSPDRKIREIVPRESRDRSVSLSCDSSANNCDSLYGNDSFNLRNSHSLDLRSLSRVPFRVNSVMMCDRDERPANWCVETTDVESGERTTYRCRYLVLANGASDLPNRLDFAKGRKDPKWVFHDLRSLEVQLDEYLQDRAEEDVEPVLIVGAGLSAADAVIAVRGRNVHVMHVFRNKTADLNKQLPENMYPEYHKVHQMMQDGGSNYPYYTAFPEYHLSNIDAPSHSVILTSKSGEFVKIRVAFVAVLIGARPDLSFLPFGSGLGTKKNLPVDCKNNTLDIDQLTHSVHGFENLFAVGPLAGDNFVRFIPGGALAVVSELYKRNDDYINC